MLSRIWAVRSDEEVWRDDLLMLCLLWRVRKLDSSQQCHADNTWIAYQAPFFSPSLPVSTPPPSPPFPPIFLLAMISSHQMDCCQKSL